VIHQSHEMHQRFVDPARKHVLQITNHGVHQWQVVPGLPDTGGQNVYVNQFTEALVNLGFRVTIVNRGGYPHPVTGQMQEGEVFHPSGHARILYLEDGRPEFVRKEDMNEQLPKLAADLKQKLKKDGETYKLIISHYWDAGKLGTMINGKTGPRVPHVWVPHSLGALKKENMPPSSWAHLRIDERIEHERAILPELDGCVSTSAAIREAFMRHYQYEPKYFLPPCVDEYRFRPMSPDVYEPVWAFLAEHSPLTAEEIRPRPLILEISRTDKTKRKDILIRAFAKVKKQIPDALLAVTADPLAGDLYRELQHLIERKGLDQDIIVLGSVWEQLPMLYNAASVYCTPSVMEGFGMSAQEAAAVGTPVVASDLVPFVVEYLLDHRSVERMPMERDGEPVELLFGEGGVVVPADFVDGFAEAMIRLLTDESLRRSMGRRAHEITIPYFTWNRMVSALLDDLGLSPDGQSEMKAS
jgi:glycosyltransferase involved in cell wall biosynthesis